MTNFGQMNDPHLEAQNNLASAWMKRGIALLNEGAKSGLITAIHYFDKAIQLRNTLPLASNPWYRYCLAAGWMNRGDALTRLGSLERLEQALPSYDAALAHLNCLPLDANPLYRERLVIAWLNRGITLEAAKNFGEAVRSFDECLAVLNNEKASLIPRRKQLLGCAWMNRGNALLQLDDPDAMEVYKSAKLALSFLTETERTDPVTAEAALKAHHVLCQAMAIHAASDDGAMAQISEAIDAAKSGISLAHDWESRGLTNLRAPAWQLFCFGVHACQKYQPQILVEFIVNNLQQKQMPDAKTGRDVQTAVISALWRAFDEIQQNGFRTFHTSEFAQSIETLKNLSLAENSLNEFLQATPPSPA